VDLDCPWDYLLFTDSQPWRLIFVGLRDLDAPHDLSVRAIDDGQMAGTHVPATKAAEPAEYGGRHLIALNHCVRRGEVDEEDGLGDPARITLLELAADLWLESCRADLVDERLSRWGEHRGDLDGDGLAHPVESGTARAIAGNIAGRVGWVIPEGDVKAARRRK